MKRNETKQLEKWSSFIACESSSNKISKYNLNKHNNF